VRRQVDASVAALSLIEEGARNEELLAATAEVRLATEQLAEAQAYLDKSFIRARSDGTVLRLFREAGEAVSTQPATAVAEMGDTSNLIVRAQIDEGEIADLAVGQMAEISAPAFGERRLSGRIVRLSPRIGTKIVEADTAGEKRDTRVLDAIIALDAGTAVPVNLRVDVFIYPSTHVAELEPSSGPLLDNWSIRE
jgi:multidrug resistance efflux pump